jgi:antitoxin component of MazEF toxin-antitoxin module
MEIQTRTKKWGCSLGVIIPKNVVEQQRIKEGQEIILDISCKRKTKGSDVFGKLKFNKSVQKLMDETDTDFEL